MRVHLCVEVISWGTREPGARGKVIQEARSYLTSTSVIPRQVSRRVTIRAPLGSVDSYIVHVVVSDATCMRSITTDEMIASLTHWQLPLWDAITVWELTISVSSSSPQPPSATHFYPPLMSLPFSLPACHPTNL